MNWINRLLPLPIGLSDSFRSIGAGPQPTSGCNTDPGTRPRQTGTLKLQTRGRQIWPVLSFPASSLSERQGRHSSSKIQTSCPVNLIKSLFGKLRSRRLAGWLLCPTSKTCRSVSPRPVCTLPVHLDHYSTLYRTLGSAFAFPCPGMP